MFVFNVKTDNLKVTQKPNLKSTQIKPNTTQANIIPNHNKHTYFFYQRKIHSLNNGNLWSFSNGIWYKLGLAQQLIVVHRKNINTEYYIKDHFLTKKTRIKKWNCGSNIV